MNGTKTQPKPILRVKRKLAPRRSLARFVRILQSHLPELTQEHHVKSLGIFGSYVRHEEKPRSDLDLVFEFSKLLTFEHKLDLVDLLSDLLGVKVEVIETEALPPYIRKRVMREVLWLQQDGIALPVKLPRRKPTRSNGRHNRASMEPKREYLDYMQDKLDNMARVQRFVAGITLQEMVENEEKNYAVRFALQTIGEAANRVPDDIRKLYPQIPWRDIINLRNAMAHGDDHIIYTKVWEAITISIPHDEPLVAQMLQDEKKRRGIDENDA